MIDDPLGLIVQVIFVLAAGMYPVGLVFATCSDCCQKCRNDSCEGFDLEEAFSCRGGGVPVCFRSPDLLSLSFASPCFGSGAAGTVQGTGADVGAGPLTGVTLTNGGSGYAILGRRAPVITLANPGPVVKATTTVNLSNHLDACNIDFWRVESVTVTDGGRGHALFQPVVFAVESGGVTTTAATGRLITRIGEPSLTAVAPSPGAGAVFEVTMALRDPTEWVLFSPFTVSAVAVIAPGAGYTDGASLGFLTTDGAELLAAQAIINTNVDGAITSVTVQQGGAYGVMGVLDSVEIFDRGNYHYPDPSLPAYVRPPNITVVQTYPHNQGSGAQVTATVDENPASPTFGSVTGLTLTSAGTGYLAWYKDEIEYRGDGKFAMGNYEPFYPINFPQKGCWVSGEGIAFGTRVTDMSHEILDMGESGPPRGCCRYTYTYTSLISGASGTGQVVFVSTEQDCEDHFDNPLLPNTGYVISNKRDYSWGPSCEDCNGNPIRTRDFVVERTYSNRAIVTVDPPPQGPLSGCVQFCGQSGLCGPLPGKLIEEQMRYGEDQTHESELRRMCVRWLCRCYEGTGKRDQPPTSVIASADGGAGATFSLGFEPYENGFFLSSVTVTNGGSGYAESGSVTFSGGEGEGYYSPAATFYSQRVEPTVTLSVAGVGSGASLIAVLANNYGIEYEGEWGLASISIESGGSGYSQGDAITATVTDGVESWPGSGVVEEVDDAGSITQVRVTADGGYYKNNGIIGSVTIEDGGFYPQPFPDPYDWYTVESTTEVGGPVLFGGTITEKLEAAEVEYSEYEMLEHQTLFGGEPEWGAEEGSRICLVYAFVFFGTSQKAIQDRCNFPDDEAPPDTVTPKDVYQIFPCNRCSCQ